MSLLLVAVLVSGALAADVPPAALWIEGEAYFAQSGSVGPDRPPFAARGECLGSHWGGRKNDLAVYRFELERPWHDAAIHLRYARLPESDSSFDLFCDTKPVARRAAFKSTAGWGHLRDDEWQYRVVPLGPLAAGWHELKLVSLAGENNTNLDGFFLAGPSFKPPATRTGIEAFPQPQIRRGPNTRGPEWVDEALSLDDFTPELDDWYYPREEQAERAGLKFPVLVAAEADAASLAAAEGADPVRVPVGGEFSGWRLAETLAQPEPMAVLEREFDRWGLIVFLGKKGVAAEVRKAVGRLEAIRRPHARFPAGYFDQLLAAKEDVLGNKLLASGRDASYPRVAGYLAPLATYTFLGSPESAAKYIVQPDGAIGLLPGRWGGDKRLEKTLFDPADVIPGLDPNLDPLGAKRGLLGGWLPAVNYGFFDAERGFGWELAALADIGPDPAVFIRVRSTDGKTRFYKIEPFEELAGGKPFFAALLRVHRSWQRFFAAGIELDLPDRRVTDAARAGIVRAVTGYAGLHPKYGMGGYWAAQHDGFPPTTISMATCLLDWGLTEAVKTRLGYYLDRFVKPDGTLGYYGPAVAEYGQIVDLAAACVRRTGDMAWFDHHRPAIDRLVEHLLRLRTESKESQSPEAVGYGLLFGGAEADTRKETHYYFSGSAWGWRGLHEAGKLFGEIGRQRGDDNLVRRGEQILAKAEALRADVLRAVERSIVAAGEQPFLPPMTGFKEPFATMTQDRLASYTNYRYWLETLSARCLEPEQERMILDYRLAHGGELLGMTRFSGHLDDWPYWHHASGVLGHDRVSHYLLGYFGHMAHHQTPGTFTAYEQVPIRGYGLRRETADYCVPAQLITPIMTRWMLVFEEPDADVLWLCRAVPRAWLQKGLSFRGALTRWGPVAVTLEPSDDLHRFTARITLAAGDKPTVMLRVRHPQRLKIADCAVTGGRCEHVDAKREWVRLRPEAATVTVELNFQA